MAGEWPTRSIDELKAKSSAAIAIGPFGSRMKSDCYVPSGVPVIRGTNISDTRDLVGEMVYITPEKAEEVRSSIIFADDLFFPHRGSIGLVGIVPRNGAARYVQSSSMMKLTCDRSQVEPLYLFYFFRSAQGRQELLKNASTVGTPGIGQPLSSLKAIRVPYPPLAEQKAIAAVLGALDDKIELNRRMNATLEAMARALFQSWFVDFDPVRAKLDGREPVGLDAATAALFPEDLEDSPLGHIPKGWAVKTIQSLCDVITSGGTPARMHKAYWEPATVPWFKTGELIDGPLIDAEEKISDEGLANSSCKLWPAGTILFALYASPTVGRFGVLTKPGTANQAAAALIAKSAYGVPFLMGLLYEARAELQRVAVGAAQQNINQGVLKSHVVIAPPPALARAYSDKVAPWFEQRIKLAEQSRTLATLRDTLLPKLLSGELSVSQYEQAPL
jgi:type I restriction enzyme S subunit